MATSRHGLTEIFDRNALRGLLALPAGLQRLLAGPPVVIDGQTLSVETQLMLRARGLAKATPVENLPIPAAREELRYQQLLAGAGLPIGSVQEVQAAGRAARMYVPAGADPVGPLLVFFHGGGWIYGDLDSHDPACRFLAEEAGVRVLSIDYRLASPPRWQDAVGDVKCALGWIRTNAAEYGVDPGNISVAGDSAGGQLAMMAAYTVGDEQFPPTCDTEEAPVASVMSWYAPTDLTTLADSDMPASAEGYLVDYLGGTLEAETERYEAASPINHVTEGLPPTMIVQGEADRLVSTGQGAALADALESAGVPVTQLDLPWTHHGFTGHWGGWGSQVLRPAVTAFLDEYAKH